jgi:hypothetical protein
LTSFRDLMAAAGYAAPVNGKENDKEEQQQ